MEKTENEERQIVVPGETIVKGNQYLPGEGTYRSKDDVVAKRFGIASVLDKHVKVIGLSGAYFPRRGNTIIGTIIDITFNGWLIDFGGAQNAFLPVAEVPRYINKNELRDYLDFGDTIVVKVWDVKSRGVDVSMKMRGFGKIEGGMIMSVNANKVPRIIGKEGSMVKLIKSTTGCNLTVGQNGKVWISGSSIDKEIQTRKIVEFVVENAVVSGLTEKVKDFMKKMGLEFDEDVEIIEENTDGEENGN